MAAGTELAEKTKAADDGGKEGWKEGGQQEGGVKGKEGGKEGGQQQGGAKKGGSCKTIEVAAGTALAEKVEASDDGGKDGGNVLRPSHAAGRRASQAQGPRCLLWSKYWRSQRGP